jgi:hypothetical protein
LGAQVSSPAIIWHTGRAARLPGLGVYTVILADTKRQEGKSIAVPAEALAEVDTVLNRKGKTT